MAFYSHSLELLACIYSSLALQMAFNVLNLNGFSYQVLLKVIVIVVNIYLIPLIQRTHVNASKRPISESFMTNVRVT